MGQLSVDLSVQVARRYRSRRRRTEGAQFPRHFTSKLEPGQTPYDQVTWELRTATIGNDKGAVIFEQRDIETPATGRRLPPTLSPASISMAVWGRRSAKPAWANWCIALSIHRRLGLCRQLCYRSPAVFAATAAGHNAGGDDFEHRITGWEDRARDGGLAQHRPGDRPEAGPRGADIVVNTLSDRDAAQGVAREIQALGRKSLVQVADIVDRKAVDRMVREAKRGAGPDRHSRVQCLEPGPGRLLDLDYKTWRRVIDITLDGTFHCAQATLPGMIAKGWGRIITLGGIAWHAGVKRRAHNLTGKSGLTGLTRALAVEFGDKGITANVIAPGTIETARPASPVHCRRAATCRRCRAAVTSTRSPRPRCFWRIPSRATSPARSSTSTAGPTWGCDDPFSGR